MPPMMQLHLLRSGILDGTCAFAIVRSNVRSVLQTPQLTFNPDAPYNEAIDKLRALPCFLHEELGQPNFSMISADILNRVRSGFSFMWHTTGVLDERSCTTTLLQAAVADDDDDALRVLFAQPDFVLPKRLFAFAAHVGALKCFRFLALNGGAFDKDVFNSACHGGNEEIIQVALENCDNPDRECLVYATFGFREDVYDWLVASAHQIWPGLPTLMAALVSGNWRIFVKALSCNINTNDIRSLLDCLAGCVRKTDLVNFLVVVMPTNQFSRLSMTRDHQRVLQTGSVDIVKAVGIISFLPFELKSMVEHGFVSLLEYALQCVNLSNGADLLAVALKQESLPMVQLLLDHGADLNGTDASGKSVLSYLTECTHSDIIRLCTNTVQT